MSSAATYVFAATQMAVGLILLYAAVTKLLRPRAFAALVAQYGVVSRARSGTVAATTIVAEAVLGAALLAGWQVSIAAAGAAGLFLVFLGAVGVNLIRKRPLPCGCFGSGTELISYEGALRLCLLISGAVAVCIGQSSGAVAPRESAFEESAVSLLFALATVAGLSWMMRTRELLRIWRDLGRESRSTELRGV